MSVPDQLDAKSVNYEALIQNWRQNPVQAAIDIFGGGNTDEFDLDQPQQVVLNSRWRHEYEIDLFTRGGGKTFLNGVTAVLQAMLYPGQRVGLIAPSFRQSKMIFQEIEKLYEISPLFQQAVAKGPSTTPEKCFVQFRSATGRVGSIIEALPMGTDGAKIRGARYYYVIADEVAQINPEVLDVVVGGFLATSQNPMKRAKLMNKLKARLKAGEITQDEFNACLGSGNKFVGSSTAFYQYNHLWERVGKLVESIYHQKQVLTRKGGNHEHLVVRGGPINGGQIPARFLSDGKQALTAFPWWDMSEGFMDLATIERQRRAMSNYQFLMEFGCFFPPDSEGFFRRSLLDAARRHNQFSVAHERRSGFKYVLGIDPARTSDNFAIALFEVDPAVRSIRLVRVWAYKNRPFPEMHRVVREIVREYQVSLIKMDSGGGGREMRDLLADHRNCPPGERLILEQDNEEHMRYQGDRILAPLVEFSNYEWVQGANEGMKSALEHGLMQIAAPYPVPGEIYNPSVIELVEEIEEELEKTLVEISSIITVASGNRLKWDTPSKQQHKDRYSATLLGFDAGRTLLGMLENPGELVFGFWA